MDDTATQPVVFSKPFWSAPIKHRGQDPQNCPVVDVADLTDWPKEAYHVMFVVYGRHSAPVVNAIASKADRWIDLTSLKGAKAARLLHGAYRLICSAPGITLTSTNKEEVTQAAPRFYASHRLNCFHADSEFVYVEFTKSRGRFYPMSYAAFSIEALTALTPLTKPYTDELQVRDSLKKWQHENPAWRKSIREHYAALALRCGERRLTSYPSQ